MITQGCPSEYRGTLCQLFSEGTVQKRLGTLCYTELLSLQALLFKLVQYPKYILFS